MVFPFVSFIEDIFWKKISALGVLYLKFELPHGKVQIAAAATHPPPILSSSPLLM